MAELLENLVSVDLTDELVSEIEQDLTNLENKMAFLLSLDPKDLKKLAKLHDGNRPFCETILIEARQWKATLPKPLSHVELAKDLAFTSKLNGLKTRVTKLADLLSGTHTRSGAEGLNMALLIRDYFKQQASLKNMEARAALVNINAHFKTRLAKAAKTRLENALKKAADVTNKKA